MEPTRTLTAEAKTALQEVLSRSEDTTVLVHGEGEFRQISFYAEGTRLEARIDYPE